MAGGDREVARRFDAGSKSRLTEHDLPRFSGTTLFDRIARAVCGAGCLPRKELYEAWEVARRTRRLFRGGRVVDLAGGHGLLAAIMLLLDDSSPAAIVVDTRIPESAAKLAAALEQEWPRLSGRMVFQTQPLETIALAADDVVVSSHACGNLTDVVIDRAMATGARVAVLPCCHDLGDAGADDLTGWIDGALAIDIRRAERLRSQGYRVWTQTIPAKVTPKNRLLLGSLRDGSGGMAIRS
jgi:hypothetical protein